MSLLLRPSRWPQHEMPDPETTLPPAFHPTYQPASTHRNGSFSHGGCSSDAALVHPARHPISRWYLLSAAQWLARRLAGTRVRPAHCTLANLALVVLAAVVIVRGAASPVAASLVLAAWFLDRLDGALARATRRETPYGAWLDANVDEFGDVLLHGAIAWHVAASAQQTWPAVALAMFLGGKYLLLVATREAEATRGYAVSNPAAADRMRVVSGFWKHLRSAVHAGGNADVRVHVLAVALLLGWQEAALGYVAAYYPLRVLIRYLMTTGRNLSERRAPASARDFEPPTKPPPRPGSA